MQVGAILVGDVGGTNVRFALARPDGDGGAFRLTDIWKAPGEDFASFAATLDAYLASLDGAPRAAGACFGFAGPVAHGRVELLHRGWAVAEADVCEQLGVGRVVFANDFIAMARAAPDEAPDGLAQIAPGEADAAGAIAVGGPGTGFGVAILRPYAPEGEQQPGWIVVGGEGGHQAYSPQTDFEWRVSDILRARLGYVSNEHVASGSGFKETLEAVAEASGASPPQWSEPELLAQAKGGDTLALAMCRLRAATVMTAMGDMALLANTSGGVYLAGGISTRITPWLREKEALDRFYQRGPRTELVSRIPIKLITSDTAPLMGAALLWRDADRRGWL